MDSEVRIYVQKVEGLYRIYSHFLDYVITNRCRGNEMEKNGKDSSLVREG